MTVDDIVAVIAPQLVGQDLTGAIELAQMTLAQGVCDDKRDMLIAYLVAHILTLANRGNGSAQDISAIKEGALSISYGSAMQGYAGDYGATSYGQRYLMLLRACNFLPRTRAMCV